MKKNNKTTTVAELPTVTFEHSVGFTHLPDNRDYTNRFEIRSESSNNKYIIAQHKHKRHWSCGCKGWIYTRHCKHLDALGLPGYSIPFEPEIQYIS